jgi:hypothetical protein
LAALVVLLAAAVLTLTVLYTKAVGKKVAAGQDRMAPDAGLDLRTQFERLAADHPDNGQLLYGMAQVLAVSAAGAESRAVSDDYATLAVDLLKKARGAGHFEKSANAELLNSDPTFAVLRTREDYKKLVQEVTK